MYYNSRSFPQLSGNWILNSVLIEIYQNTGAVRWSVTSILILICFYLFLKLFVSKNVFHLYFGLKCVSKKINRNESMAYLMIGCRCTVRMMTWVSTASTPSIASPAHTLARASTSIRRAVVIIPQISGFGVSLIDDQIDWHFSLQTTYVTLTEIVAQLVHLNHSQHIF